MTEYDIDDKESKSRGDIGIIFMPHRDVDEFDFERVRGTANTIINQLNSKLINVQTLEIMTEDEMAKTLGGDPRSVEKGVYVTISQSEMGKTTPIGRQKVDKIKKAIEKRAGYRLSDQWFILCTK